MWVRTQLRIGWRDLLAGAVGCLFPGDRAALTEEVEGYWSVEEPAIAAYSVRSGFDMLLQAMDLEPGDEVIFSALNVRGMVRAVRQLGLVPVPVDLDIAHFNVTRERLEAAITPRSKVFVAAHLFGARMDLDSMFKVAQEHGLMAVEDCAQAFNGKAYPGSGIADVNLFSFGPIKTATALGGALIRVKDPQLRNKMREIQAAYPVQANKKHLKRILQFAALKVVTLPRVLALIHGFYKRKGENFEDALSDKARDVAPLRKTKNLRWQPSAGMLGLLKRRLDTFSEGSLAERTALGERLRDLVDGAVVLPAQRNAHHDYWVFALLIDDTKTLIEALRDDGFDAADLPRSQAVPAPEDRPERTAEIASQAMKDIVVVPCYPGMPDSELVRLAGSIKRAARKAGTARTFAYADK